MSRSAVLKLYCRCFLVSAVLYSALMGKIWSADELMAMSFDERLELFRSKSSTDLADVPEHLLEQARQDIRSYRESAPSVPAVE